MIFACHKDDERSQRTHVFWYRFGDGVVWFTFKTPDVVPAVCDCGNEFQIPDKQRDDAATRAVAEFKTARSSGSKS